MLKKKYLDLVDSNQFKPYDIAILKISIFTENSNLTKINEHLTKSVRLFKSTLADPFLKDLNYFEIKNLNEACLNFLKSANIKKEKIDIKREIDILELNLNTFVCNSKILLSNDSIQLENCVIQTDFFKFKLD